MNEQEKIIQLLKTRGISAYKIAKETGISEAAIGNYIAGKSKPNQIYTKCLKYFFDSQNVPKSSNQSIAGDNNIQSGNNSRVNYSGSYDVLKAQIEERDRIIAEKEERIKEKDAQIKEKDAQINKLLSILSK